VNIKQRLAGLEKRAGLNHRPYLLLMTEDEQTFRAEGKTYTGAELAGLSERYRVVVWVGTDPDGGEL